MSSQKNHPFQLSRWRLLISSSRIPPSLKVRVAPAGDTFMVTLQILASLIVLPGRRLIVLPLSESTAGAANDDCELEPGFRDFFRRRPYWLTLRELLNLIFVFRCVDTASKWPDFIKFLRSHCYRCNKVEKLVAPVYSTSRKGNKRASHCASEKD